MTDQLKIRRPDDWHVHLRDGTMLQFVLPYTAKLFGRALVMPNLTPPVLTAEDMRVYRGWIQSHCKRLDLEFEPMMTVKLVPESTPAMIREAKKAGAIAGKLYPQGVTTNSEDGWSDLRVMWPVFEAMEEVGMVLCLHGEEPAEFVMDRERAFAKKPLHQIARDFPKLTIIMEHITTQEAAVMVTSILDNVYATVTPHHLEITLDDVIGGALRPHLFCKPIAKRKEDRDAVLGAAIHCDKVFLGTDSAPHAIGRKECDHGCAGVFNALTALPVVAEVFEKHGALDKLEEFTSLRGAACYGVEPHEETVLLKKESWPVPEVLRDETLGIEVKPYRGGTHCNWRVIDVQTLEYARGRSDKRAGHGPSLLGGAYMRGYSSTHRRVEDDDSPW